MIAFISSLLRRWLRKLILINPKQRRAFFINIFVGIMIAVAFAFIESTNFGERQTAWQMDSFDAVQSNKLTSMNHSERARFISDKLMFVEITHEHFVKTGRQPLTSRKTIADMLDKVASSGAAVVLVDVILDRKDTEDQYLAATVAKIKASGRTKVIFPITRSIDGTFGTNILSDAIDNKTVFLGRPTIGMSNFDGIVRYWRPYEVGKDSVTGDQTVFWNTALLAVALLHNSADRLMAHEEQVPLLTKGKPIELAFNQNTKILLGTTDTSGGSNRIRFLLSPNGADWKTGETRIGTIPLRMNITTEELQAVTDSAFLGKMFGGKIVIMGNSSPDLGDYHLTSIGSMPGMYIQGNIVNMIDRGLTISSKAKTEALLLEAILIILAAYLFVIFPPNIAKLFLTIALSLVMVLAFFYLQYTGMFINVILPLLGISIHNLVSTLEHLLERRH